MTKRELNKWKIKKEMNEKKRIEELKMSEMNEINVELKRLKEEYERVMSERGLAHRAAQLIQQQEYYLNLHFNRRELNVRNRAQNTLNQFQKQTLIKEKESKINKEKQIIKRKQLMKSSLRKENVDNEDINILRQLQKLENAEKRLRELINSKKELSNCETSIERHTEKLFGPKRLFSNQQFLYSSASSIDSHQNVPQIEIKTDSNANNLKTRSDVSIQTDIDERRVEPNNDFPLTIATQLYEKLKSRQTIREIKEQTNDKIYRNVGISTTTPSKTCDEVFDYRSIPECSAVSNETSYLSLPAIPQMPSNKATDALSKLYKNQLLNKRSNSLNSKSTVSTINLDSNSFQNITPFDDSVNSLDPLITRINNLKELINRKVGESFPNNSVLQNRSDRLSSGGDFAQIKANSQPMKRLSVIRESQSYSQNTQNDIISNGNGLQKANSSPHLVNNLFIDREEEENEDQYSDECSTSSSSFKTLHALTSSGRLSPHFDLVSQQSNYQTLSSPQLEDLSYDMDIDSMPSSFMSSEPIRDRNAFWKEIFERAGFDMDEKQIDNFLQNPSQSQASIDSFSVNTFSNGLNSHSTPK
jgi:hypothetical protein